MKKLFLITAFIGGLLCACNSGDKLIYKDASASIEDRVEDLLSRMTLEEKIYQISQQCLGENDNINNNEGMNPVPLNPMIGSVIFMSEDIKVRNVFQKKAIEETRLGIPVIYGYDVIHGYRTIYPIPLAMACSWNPGMLEACTAVAAQEARQAGVDWVFAPMIDVARDARWGRIAEGSGEDPYTAAQFAVAAVKGFQGDNLASDKKVASCLKHFVGYGASEAGRDYVYSEISDQSLWDTYLPPYEAAVKAGAQTLMSAFNDISGVPASANSYTMNTILRDMWKFDGFIVSDWGAVEQLVNQGNAANPAEAAVNALVAGVDMDMTDGVYIKNMEQLVADGKLDVKVIDEAVRRVLRVKFRLGLFENPYTPDVQENERILLASSKETAEKAAEETMVLLKNNNSILPLEGVKRIGLIGPMVKNQHDLLGSWLGHGHDEDVTTIMDAMTAEFPDAFINYAQGCDFDGEDKSGFNDAVRVANASDVVVLCLGEKQAWSGENASRSTILLPQIQRDLLETVAKAGKPVVLVLNNGRPLELSDMEPHTAAILEAWQPGISGGTPIAKVLNGKVNPSGKLCATFPYTSGQIPIYYNRRNPARKGTQGFYQDVTVEPMYPFGYGLSYTTYKYGTLKVSAEKVAVDGKLKAEISVTNMGKRAGKETVHWYITDPACSITRPMKELRYFEKAEIQPGETKVFTWDIDVAKDFSYVDAEGTRFLEAGDILVKVGDQTVKVVVE